MLKGCWGCHQTGTKATREIPASLGNIRSSAQAWTRFISSGQLGSLMNGMLSGMGHGQGVALFADWGDRIAKGELPPVPPRPQGVERNVVVTVWDWSVRAAFPYAAISTDKRNPSVNAYGPVYGGDWFAGVIAALDPAKNVKSMTEIALPDGYDVKQLDSLGSAERECAFGLLRRRIDLDGLSESWLVRDGQSGRVWFNVKSRADNPGILQGGVRKCVCEVFSARLG